jgi:ATP-dependent protease HslVU (ClpYQ) peptidase subunit
MTAILGIRENGRVIMASDGSSTMGNIKMDTYHSKIFPAQGSHNVYVAITGNAIANSAMRSQKHLFGDKNDLSYHYLVTKFVPWLQKFAKEANVLKDDKDGKEMLFSMIIGTKNKLFEITSLGSVIECEHIVARGSGSNVVLYDLMAHISEDLTPEELAINAIKRTIEYSPGLGYPLVIIDTSKEKATVFNENGERCVVDANV